MFMFVASPLLELGSSCLAAGVDLAVIIWEVAWKLGGNCEAWESWAMDPPLFGLRS